MRKLLYISLMLLCGNSYAQDVHFAQTSTIPQLLNPATVGVFQGWERVIASHRQQWIGLENPYVTSQFSADLNLLKNDNGAANSHLGIGLSFYNDVAGDAKFGTKNFSLSVAGIIPVESDQTVSAAIQVGGAQRSGNLSALTWGNQFDGTGFDTQIPSNEGDGMSSFFYGDIGAGIFYNYTGYNHTLLRKELSNLYGGVAYYHLNKPTLQYRNGTSDKLHSKLVGMAGMQWDIPKSLWAFAPSFVYMKQGPHQEIMGSLLMKFRMKEGTKYTGIYTESYLGMGLTYRNKDAIAPQVLIEFGSYKIGLLYEFTTSNLNAVSKGGFEVSFQWANMNTALFKGRRFKGWGKPGGM